jgi:hypothetical protein
LSVAHDLGDEARGIRLSGLIRAPGATRVQARASGAAERLEVVVIQAGQTGAARPGDRQPEVVTRAQWGADESMRTGTPEFAPLSKLVVHHTVTQNDDPDPAATVRAVYAYHTQANGWNDIGYHFLVDAAGRIYEGRFARPYRPGEIPTGEDESGRGVVGAHAKGANVGSVGVALLGDFRSAEPTPAALDALVRLLGWKAARHGIDPGGASPYTFTDGTTRSFPNLSGHRDVGTTACPGDKLYAHLPEIRHRVAKASGAPLPEASQPPAPPPPVPGFWTVSAEGVVEAVGDAPFFGSAAGMGLNAPVVSMAPTRSGGGYWLASSDGGVFAFGDAGFSGSAVLRPVDAPVVRLEPTPTGGGYWLVTANGGVLAFGDARFYGSALSLPEVRFVGMAATPTGEGYWLTSSDGRVFAFGDALTGGVSSGRAAAGLSGDPPSPTPIVSMAATPSGRGYWLVARDGNVFAVEAPFRGRVPEGREVVQIRATESGEGYYVAGGDGAMFAFGDADGRRERPRSTGLLAVVDVAIRPPPLTPTEP